MTRDDIFSVDRSFAAEPAANVGRVKTNSMFGKTEGVGDLGAGPVRPLTRKPHGELLAARIGTGEDSPRFHGQSYLARTGDMHGNDVIRLGERFVDVAAVLREGVTDIAVDLFAHKRRAGLECFFRVRHSGQWLVLDFDGVGRVLRLGASPRHHRGHRHAGAMHGAAREHRMRRDFHVGEQLRRREV